MIEERRKFSAFKTKNTADLVFSYHFVVISYSDYKNELSLSQRKSGVKKKFLKYVVKYN